MAVQREYAQLLKELFRDFPQSFKHEATPMRGLVEIRASLRPTELLLQPVELSNRVYLLTATSNTCELTEIVGSDDRRQGPWTDLVARCSLGLRSPASNGAEIQSALSDLGELLLGQLRHVTDGAKTLLWCPPPGHLGRIPLAALRVDGRYVAERWQTVHLPLSAMICSLRTRDSEAELVALGNPEGSLAGAEIEVGEVHAIYSGSVATGPDATAGFLREHARPGGIAHLACHGKFESDLPGLSMLRLAPADEEGHGLLFASDVSTLGLDLAMVVLSACQSGLLGSSGSEEIGGFALAFLSQAADSVLAGLWDVGDSETRALMAKFYAHLTEHSKGEALRRASVDLLSDRRFQHPYCWAPFVLMGDWRGRVRPRASTVPRQNESLSSCHAGGA